MSGLVRAALLDIWEAIGRIERYASGADEDLARLPRVNYDALLYNILVISEASRHLPDDLRAGARICHGARSP